MRFTEALTLPRLAVIVVTPWVIEVTSPTEFTVATAGVEELQLTVPVRSCVLPSANVPMAPTVSVSPEGTEGGVAGLMAIDTSGVVTSNVAVELIPLELAVIVAAPCATGVAKPTELMVAIAFADELQATVLVKSTVLPSV